MAFILNGTTVFHFIPSLYLLLQVYSILVALLCHQSPPHDVLCIRQEGEGNPL